MVGSAVVVDWWNVTLYDSWKRVANFFIFKGVRNDGCVLALLSTVVAVEPSTTVEYESLKRSLLVL